ncbi:ATP-dependent DNA helicase 2 subunit 1 [Condylostylus longicornis]|uniref:ATP-dependent DNA helicase 2 subunit 1 n=1 Tax=Condylostylus longicornis TaxID=2530218 RepID=UPI00244E59E3|nr:ATP-dependent DNA helicase 2 subunit 1 [Condylostylus longicornis]
MSAYNDHEDEESDEEDVDLFSGREAITFLIDAKLYNDIDEFANTLDIVQKSLLSGLLTRGKDFIGVVFVNTENSPEPKDLTRMKNIVVAPNTAVLLPLAELSKEIMEYFLNFTTPDYFDFPKRFGIKDGSIANAIRLCTNMFKQCGYKLSTQTIIYFTNCDEPYKEGSSEFQKCLQKAKDLDETDVQFELLPMCENFDYNKFYKEFLSMVQHIEIDQFTEPNKEELIKMISNRNLQQNSKKRCTYHLKWILGNNVEISVGLYNYFKKKVLPKSVKLLRTNNSIIDVKRVYKTKTIESGMEVDQELNENVSTEKFPKSNEEEDLKPSDTRKVLIIGGRQVEFTCEEVSRMRSPLAPGMRLLGFKNLESISFHNFVKTTSFLYPDERIINGSTTLFRALWEKCIQRKKVAICVIVPRRKVPPRFIALLPTEKKNSFNDHDGFRIVYLPFENEFRLLNLQGYSLVEAPDDGVKIFEKISNKLKIKFTPHILRDPTLEIIEANIIGSAFDIEYEGLGEGCSPDFEQQDERIQKVIENLTDIFGQDLEITKKKRPGDGLPERAQKIQKITEECPTRQQIEDLLSKEELNILTIKQLKAYLQENNVTGLSITKPKLIEKVIELHS